MAKEKLWKSIAKELSNRVSKGVWEVGSIIPGEIELAEEFQASRDTIRKALKELTSQGLFERRPKIGTRVKASHQSEKFLHELSDIKEIDQYGNKHPRRVQNVVALSLGKSAAKILGLPPEIPFLRFENIRVLSEIVEEPVVFTYVYIPANLEPVIAIAKERPYELIITCLEEATGEECTEVRQTFSATGMPATAASFFKLPPGSPSLRIIRNYLNRKGKTLSVSDSYYPADRFACSVSVRKSSARSS